MTHISNELSNKIFPWRLGISFGRCCWIIYSISLRRQISIRSKSNCNWKWSRGLPYHSRDESSMIISDHVVNQTKRIFMLIFALLTFLRFGKYVKNYFSRFDSMSHRVLLISMISTIFFIFCTHALRQSGNQYLNLIKTN